MIRLNREPPILNTTVHNEEFLNWNNPNTRNITQYKPNDQPPYIVPMKSSILEKNVGKLNPIAIANKIDEEIQGERLIQRSGQNQIKIT